VRVNSGSTLGKANVFPWVAADAYGHVVVTWLGANLAGNSNDLTAMQPVCADGSTDCWAQWNVYAAESVDGNAGVPAFTQHVASDHFIHSGTVCTNGTGCANGDSRALADFFEVALDSQHRANIAYADDHLASPLCSQQSPGHCANNDPQSFRVAVPYSPTNSSLTKRSSRPASAPDSYEWRGIPFAAWLLRTAANTMIDRSQRASREHSVPNTDPGVDLDLRAIEHRARLFRLVSQLREMQRRASEATTKFRDCCERFSSRATNNSPSGFRTKDPLEPRAGELHAHELFS
jgi:hypothetical protein